MTITTGTNEARSTVHLSNESRSTEIVELVVTNARLRDLPGQWAVVVDGGIVQSILASDTPRPRASSTVDLAGRLALPGMVDSHVHLDKAFQLSLLDHTSHKGGSLAEALRATAELRRGLIPATVARNAERLIARLVAGGTVAVRAHVEIGPDTDVDAIHMHNDLALAHPELAFEFTAFAQYGTTMFPHVLHKMEYALQNGCRVVGGCPYADEKPLAHLDQMIELALRHGASLDLHLDLSDDADDLLLGKVLPRVSAAGLGGRVVIGHETALTAASPSRVRELSAAAAEAGVGIVAIPTTDLYLSGRAGNAAPTRGVTRIKELLAAGVPVALASNNHENAFTPVSTPSLTQVAWLASLTNHMGSASEQLALLDAITTTPRTLMGGGLPGLKIGDPVGIAVFDAESPVDVVRSAARPVAVVNAAHGAVFARNPLGKENR
ncbi:amidohydrolase family protein [Microbacterium trichothecenolyticum]|uniref:amidohydrolase family protein n=1 Tax=Microbacterium trichothecenolyticum TaxID=69370 RepID=UPI001C6EB35A|nr:amidohydrolase family protein [Microbacterium trichothecenolyticum]MBW9122080.1 amidohydrolase family protein [Microbacterium trichothecenolyticum]